MRRFAWNPSKNVLFGLQEQGEYVLFSEAEAEIEKAREEGRSTEYKAWMERWIGKASWKGMRYWGSQVPGTQVITVTDAEAEITIAVEKAEERIRADERERIRKIAIDLENTYPVNLMDSHDYGYKQRWIQLSFMIGRPPQEPSELLVVLKPLEKIKKNGGIWVDVEWGEKFNALVDAVNDLRSKK